MDGGPRGADKVVLVTGAGGGIGCATAMAFAASGYRVIGADIRLGAAEQTAERIRAAGGDAIAAHADIADAGSVAALFGLIAARYGRLDAAFNNAGVGVPRRELAEGDDDEWLRSIAVNLTGTYYCLKAEIRMMLAHGGGCIVNNGSVYSLRAGVNAPYVASKHGIAGLTKSAALTYASRGVRINAVCPGLIDAGMGAALIRHLAARNEVDTLVKNAPAGRAGTAEEVASAVVWLCSDAASYLHGHLLAIDGGVNL